MRFFNTTRSITKYKYHRCDNKKINYYLILGIDNDATTDEIIRAYKKLVLKWHPDKSQHPQSARIFQGIREAYEVLRDPMRRAQYDAESSHTDLNPQIPALPNSNNHAITYNGISEPLLIYMHILIVGGSPIIPMAGIYGDYSSHHRLNILRNLAFLMINSLTGDSFTNAAPINSNFHSTVEFNAPLFNLITSSPTNSLAGARSTHSQPINSNVLSSDELNALLPNLIDIPRSLISMPPLSPNHEKLVESGFDTDLVPAELTCPLSCQIFTDPVHNPAKGLPPVERSWIEKHITTNGKDNPFNRQPLEMSDLLPHADLEKKAEEFLLNNIDKPSLKSKRP